MKEVHILNSNDEIDASTKRIFEEYPVSKALSAMVMPTVISQLILVVYNLADTWYVGQTGNADAVAAVSLCLPVYTILSAISNLFGIGGASAIARALGSNHAERARQAFSLSTYAGILSALIYALLIQIFCRPLLMLIGGDAGDIAYAITYIKWTTVIGAVPTILAPIFANMIRASGSPKEASFGMILGAVLNIGLDPLFMFIILPAGNEVAGAAIATMISNLISLIYYLLFILNNKECNAYSFHLQRRNGNRILLKDIFRSGIPGFCMVSFAMFSNCFLNSMLSVMGSEAVAGIGIVRKIDQLAFAVNQGITQGMLPLVAYCYSRNLFERMKKIIAFSAASTFIFSILCMTVSLIFAPQLTAIFIRDSATIQYGSAFLRIICLAIPVYSITFTIIAVFQAIGHGAEPFILTLLRKGSLDIILMFIIRKNLGVSLITMASPITEAIALFIGIIMLYHFLQQLKKA
jgi:putative MATE family efflux protein